MPGTTKRPSKAAVTALTLVAQLQEEVRFLRAEVRASRRLALASFGVATASLAIFAFIH
ncbi:MAG: hypothetical protein ACYC2H_09920 [Thermoplasmatota archaeon]